jgi:hypothetical protein
VSADLPAPQLQLRQIGVDEHALAWGANCGPAALAGALGLQLADVRAAVSTGPTFKGHMTIGDMKRALGRLCKPLAREWSRPPTSQLEQTRGAMTIACVQWVGPWIGTRGEPAYRHFMAYAHGYFGPSGPGWVCDVNNHVVFDGMDWAPRHAWEAHVVPLLLPRRRDGSLRGDGTWRIQWLAQL